MKRLLAVTVRSARHRQPILNKLLRGLLSQVDHAEPPERHPFKKAMPTPRPE